MALAAWDMARHASESVSECECSSRRRATFGFARRRAAVAVLVLLVAAALTAAAATTTAAAAAAAAAAVIAATTTAATADVLLPSYCGAYKNNQNSLSLAARSYLLMITASDSSRELGLAKKWDERKDPNLSMVFFVEV